MLATLGAVEAADLRLRIADAAQVAAENRIEVHCLTIAMRPNKMVPSPLGRRTETPGCCHEQEGRS
jgi:hypothetical protein